MNLETFILDNTTMTTHRCGESFAFLPGETLHQAIETLKQHECPSDEVLRRRGEFRVTNSAITHNVCGAVKALPHRVPHPVKLKLVDDHVCNQETWDGKPPEPEDINDSGPMDMGGSKA